MASRVLKPLLLNNGHTMPRLGLGTFLLGEKGQEIVTTAIEMGYRHIDTAYSYGTEQDVGAGLNQCIKSGLVKRGDVFITSKVPPALLNPKHVSLCVEESLDRLKTSYIDLLLVHSPWRLKYKDDGNLRPVGIDGYHYDYDLGTCDLSDTWTAFEDIVKSGKVRSIGLSNCKEGVIRKVLHSCKIKPQNIQFECHLHYQQSKLKQLCDDSGIACTGYAPLGAPGIPSHHLHGNKDGPIRLLENEDVAKIATKYGKTPAQVLLRYLLQKGFVVVPKTSSVKRLAENVNIYDFQITEDDMNVLKSQDRGLRYFTFPQYRKHPEFPKDGEPF